jgi:hypothetical protein
VALAVFSKLFWPDFVEIEGCILLSEHYEAQNFEQWKAELKGERAKIELVLNEVNVYDLFIRPADNEPGLDLYEYMAKMLLKSWRCALHDTFPNKHFKFVSADEPDAYGPTLSFYQATTD